LAKNDLFCLKRRPYHARHPQFLQEAESYFAA
jgi:hypothetical protein